MGNTKSEKMKKINFKVGDLVQHKYDKKYGIVMSDIEFWGSEQYRGIPFCKIAWIDFHSYNLMDIRLLEKIKIQPLERR